MIVYRVNEHNEGTKQKFDAVVDEFCYDEKTNTLIIVGKIDLQEQLQSGLSYALDKILDRFLDSSVSSDNVVDSDNIFDTTENFKDLTELGQVIERANYYRELFGLSDELSYDEVFSQAQAKLNSLVNLKENMEVDDNENEINKEEK